MTIAFDTHAYIKELRTAGVSEPQAEVQAHALIKIVENDLATKEDIKELEASTKLEIELVRRDIKALEASTKLEIELVRRDIKALEASMNQKIKELESSMNQKIKELEVSMIHKIKELELSTKRDIAEAKNDVIKWVAGMLIAQSGVMITLFKLFGSN